VNVTIQGYDSKIYIANNLVMVEPEHPTSFKVGEQVVIKLIEGENYALVIDPLDREADPYHETWKVSYLKPKIKYPVNNKPYIKPLEYDAGIVDYIMILGWVLMIIWCIWMFIKVI